MRETWAHRRKDPGVKITERRRQAGGEAKGGAMLVDERAETWVAGAVTLYAARHLRVNKNS